MELKEKKEKEKKRKKKGKNSEREIDKVRREGSKTRKPDNPAAAEKDGCSFSIVQESFKLMKEVTDKDHVISSCIFRRPLSRKM